MAQPTLISRQEGSHTFTSGTTQNIAITSVDTTHTWVRISIQADEASATNNVSFYTTADLTSSTNLRLQRGGTLRDVHIEWVVLEFDTSVNVYRGSFAQTLSTTDTAVTSVDLAKSISESTYRTTATTATTANIRDCMIRSRLTSSTNLRTNVFTAFSGNVVHWQVIEFTQDISVQQFDGSSSTWPLNISITSVDLTKSFLMFSWSANASASLCAEDLLSCRFTTSTNVRMEDFFAGVISKFYNFYVVEYTGSDDFDVDRGYTTMLSTSTTPTISVTKDNSSLMVGHEYNSMLEVDVCSNDFGDSSASSVVDSDVAFTATRFDGTDEATIAWEAVNWASSAQVVVQVPFWTFYKRSI